MNENEAWDIYFSGAVGWTLHPGHNKDQAKKPTLLDCADIADDMIKIRRDRWPTSEQS